MAELTTKQEAIIATALAAGEHGTWAWNNDAGLTNSMQNLMDKGFVTNTMPKLSPSIVTQSGRDAFFRRQKSLTFVVPDVSGNGVVFDRGKPFCRLHPVAAKRVVEGLKLLAEKEKAL